MIDLKTLYNWIKENKKQLFIALAFTTLGLIAMNQLISIYAKADLLVNSCELCIRKGYQCIPKMPLLINITP